MVQDPGYQGHPELAPCSYEVQWTDGVGPSVMQFPDILRKKPLYTKAQVKSWLAGVAECEQTDYKPMPCIWRVLPPLSDKYGLPSELPPDIEAKLQRAAKNKAEKERKAGQAAAAAAAVAPSPAAVAGPPPAAGERGESWRCLVS